MKFQLRSAAISDCDSIESLIAASARRLSLADYSPEQVEGALKTAFGVDTQLIVDQSYFVVESGRLLVGCGGWSFRETLFGSDTERSRDSNRANPETGAAKIRAFFVRPEFSRMGVASMILRKCEQEAFLAGFRKLELMSTLPGRKFYEKHGYVAGTPIHYPLDGQLAIEFVPMHKDLSVSI